MAGSTALAEFLGWLVACKKKSAELSAVSSPLPAPLPGLRSSDCPTSGLVENAAPSTKTFAAAPQATASTIVPVSLAPFLMATPLSSASDPVVVTSAAAATSVYDELAHR